METLCHALAVPADAVFWIQTQCSSPVRVLRHMSPEQAVESAVMMGGDTETRVDRAALAAQLSTFPYDAGQRRCLYWRWSEEQSTFLLIVDAWPVINAPGGEA